MTWYKPAEEAAQLAKKLGSPGTNRAIVEAIEELLTGAGKSTEGRAHRLFETLLPDAGTEDAAFALASLQKAFDHDRARISAVDELDWILRTRSEAVKDVLALAGIRRVDLEKLVELRRQVFSLTGPIHVSSIAKSEYVDDLVDPFMDVLALSGTRLDQMIEWFRARDVIRTLKATGEITQNYMWRGKGELTEMACLPVKRRYLDEVDPSLFPDAHLVENIMARTKKTLSGDPTSSSAFRAIYDGAIVHVDRHGLALPVKFEIKSGLFGFIQGWTQIGRTRTSRFASVGDEIKLTLENGNTRIFRSGVDGPDGIRTLEHLEDELTGGGYMKNVLIGPSGVSSMLPNQIITGFDDVMQQHIHVVYEILSVGGRELTHTDIEYLFLQLLLKA